MIDATTTEAGERQPVTIRTLARMTRAGQRFACLTCYDATTARWLERAGVHVLLVGDTAAEVVLGLPGTVHAPLDVLLALTAGVKRGAPNTVVMGDMPFMSYQADEADGIRNAGRFLTEGLADLVKLEVDASYAPLVARITRAGVPVVAHVGSRPQRAKQQGGYVAAGRTVDDACSLLEDAARMVDAGATMLLIEAAPAEVTQAIVERTPIPVIGCGAGPACHGQVVVLQDLLGLSEWQPAFALPAFRMGDALMQAGREWRSRVAANELGEHPITMPAHELDAFRARLATRGV